MGIKEADKNDPAAKLLNQFMNANTLRGILQSFHNICDHYDLRTSEPSFYWKLRSKLTTWKAQSLWAKIDKKANQKEYNKGTACSHTRVFIIGAGPCGLRTAIEAALLGARTVLVEKRDRFSRNNVLHLWPHVIYDLKSLGGKKFYGKFCAGAIDHISIRQLQCMLLKAALVCGVDVQINVGFEGLVAPPEDQSEGIGWKAKVTPTDHPLSEYEFDVLIGADGKRNTLDGFKRKEFRGKLAIAITANFINFHSAEEAQVEEISGVAFIFNQKFFQDLKEETRIDLENIVYYKDETHYFVMTAKKQSLLEKGVLLNDYPDTAMLLARDNVNQEALRGYAKEAADVSTKKQLPVLEFAHNHYGQADLAMFDFTSMFAAINASRIVERKNHKLLLCLVGDSLLEPFWPTGSGCARGFLGAQDAAWSIRSFAAGTMTPLEVLAERESVYQLLSQTTPENVSKVFSQHTLDPQTRYPTLNKKFFKPAQVRSFYDTDRETVDDIIEIPLKRRQSGEFIRDYDRLLRWFKRTLNGYKNMVKIEDLSTSWKNGLGLCALIHYFRPDLIDISTLSADRIAENNQKAYDILEKEFEISPIMTGVEMASCDVPDRLSMWSYLSQVHEMFKTDSPYKELMDSRSIDSLSPEDGPHLRLPHSPSQRRSLLNRISHRFQKFKQDHQEEPDDQSGLRPVNMKNKPMMTFGGSLPKRQKVGLPEMPGRSVHLSKMEETMEEAQKRLDLPPGVYEIGPRGNNKVSNLATMLFPTKKEEKLPEKNLIPPKRQSHYKQLAVKRKEKATMLNDMINTGSGSQFCYFCEKRVYLMERLSAEGLFFHRGCLKCDYCNTTLRLGNYAFDRTPSGEAKFYCIQHMGFKKRLRRQRISFDNVDSEAQMKEAEEEQPPPRPPLPMLSRSRFMKSSDQGGLPAPLTPPSVLSLATPERVEFENSIEEESQECPEEITIEHNLRRSLSSVDFDDEDIEDEEDYDDEDDDDEDEFDDEEDSDEDGSGDSDITALSEQEIMAFLGSSSEDESDIEVSSLEDDDEVPMTWEQACKLAEKLKHRDKQQESKDENKVGEEADDEDEDDDETIESDSTETDGEETEEETEEEDEEEENEEETRVADQPADEVIDISNEDKSHTPRMLGIAKEQFFTQMAQPVRIDPWDFFRRNKLIKEQTPEPAPEQTEAEKNVDQDTEDTNDDTETLEEKSEEEEIQDHSELEKQFEELAEGLDVKNEEDQEESESDENVISEGLAEIAAEDLMSPKHEVMEEIASVAAGNDVEMKEAITTAMTEMSNLVGDEIDVSKDKEELDESDTTETEHDMSDGDLSSDEGDKENVLLITDDTLDSIEEEVNAHELSEMVEANLLNSDEMSTTIECVKNNELPESDSTLSNVNECLDKTNDVEECLDKTDDVEECLDKTDDVEECLDKTDDVEECLDKTDDVEERLDKTDDVDECLDKTDDIDLDDRFVTIRNRKQQRDSESSFTISTPSETGSSTHSSSTSLTMEVAMNKMYEHDDTMSLVAHNQSLVDESSVLDYGNDKSNIDSKDIVEQSDISNLDSIDIDRRSDPSISMEVEINQKFEHDDTMLLLMKNQEQSLVVNGDDSKMDTNDNSIDNSDAKASDTSSCLYVTPDTSITETNNNKTPTKDDSDSTPVVSPNKSPRHRKRISNLRSEPLSPIRNLKKSPLRKSPDRDKTPVVSPDKALPLIPISPATRPANISVSPIYRVPSPRYEMDKRRSQSYKDYSIVNIKKPQEQTKPKPKSGPSDLNDAMKILMGGGVSKAKTRIPVDGSLLKSPNEETKVVLPEGKYKVEEGRKKIMSPHISFDSFDTSITSDIFATPATSMKPTRPMNFGAPIQESTPVSPSAENANTTGVSKQKQSEIDPEKLRAYARAKARQKTDEELGIAHSPLLRKLSSPCTSPVIERPFRRQESSPLLLDQTKKTLFMSKAGDISPQDKSFLPRQSSTGSRSLPCTPVSTKLFIPESESAQNGAKNIVTAVKSDNSVVETDTSEKVVDKTPLFVDMTDSKPIVSSASSVQKNENGAKPVAAVTVPKRDKYVKQKIDANKETVNKRVGLIEVDPVQRTSILAEFDDDSDLNVPSPEKAEDKHFTDKSDRSFNERAVDVYNERAIDVPPAAVASTSATSPVRAEPVVVLRRDKSSPGKMKKSKSLEKLTKSLEKLSPKKNKKHDEQPDEPPAKPEKQTPKDDAKESKKDKRKSLLAMLLPSPKTPDKSKKDKKNKKDEENTPILKTKRKTPKSKDKKKGKHDEGNLLEQMKQLSIGERKERQPKPQILTTAAAANFDEEISDSESERGSTMSRMSLDRISVQAKRSARAARKQQRQKELRRLRMAQEIQRHMQEIEVKQKDLEEQGVVVEKALRGEGQENDKNENQLMQQWFNLVHEKNALVRYESELMVKARELELEDRHGRLEQQLRERMSTSEEKKSPTQVSEEKKILDELLEVVEQRDSLVALLEEDRLRQQREDESLQAIMTAKGFQLSPITYSRSIRQALGESPLLPR